jgi:hypothetical protein
MTVASGPTSSAAPNAAGRRRGRHRGRSRRGECSAGEDSLSNRDQAREVSWSHARRNPEHPSPDDGSSIPRVHLGVRASKRPESASRGSPGSCPQTKCGQHLVKEPTSLSGTPRYSCDNDKRLRPAQVLVRRLCRPSLTRKRSEVQILYRPQASCLVTGLHLASLN